MGSVFVRAGAGVECSGKPADGRGSTGPGVWSGRRASGVHEHAGIPEVAGRCMLRSMSRDEPQGPDWPLWMIVAAGVFVLAYCAFMMWVVWWAADKM